MDKYIDVLLEIGIGMQPGEKIFVSAEPIHWDFAVRLAERAYRQDAAYVRVQSVDARVERARMLYAEEKYLEYVPSWAAAMQDVFRDEHWSLVRISGPADPDVLNDAAPGRMKIAGRAAARVVEPYSKYRMDGTCPWNIIALPTPAWAGKVMDMAPGDKAVEALTQELVKIMRLDADDPVDAWRKHNQTLKHRAEILNQSKLSYLHFTGPGTDLKVYLADRSFWIGGNRSRHDGKKFMPNLPTEEVFTVPHCRKTEGTVRVTKPIRILGKIVRGARFEFNEGKLVSLSADEGQDRLENLVDFDEGVRFLGEVALVDISSPIYQSGRLFDSILFDENACCHIALGRSLPMAITDGASMDKKELLESGANHSLVHNDFMIGSEEVSVTGYDKGGSSMAIIKDGSFVL